MILWCLGRILTPIHYQQRQDLFPMIVDMLTSEKSTTNSSLPPLRARFFFSPSPFPLPLSPISPFSLSLLSDMNSFIVCAPSTALFLTMLVILEASLSLKSSLFSPPPPLPSLLPLQKGGVGWREEGGREECGKGFQFQRRA